MFDSFFPSSCNEVMPAVNYRPNYMYGSLSVDRGYDTNFLGGMSMARPLAQDVYSGVKLEECRNKSGLKNTLLGFGAFVVGTVILGKFRKLGKGFSGLFGSAKP